jgi:hypothetical protein
MGRLAGPTPLRPLSGLRPPFSAEWLSLKGRPYKDGDSSHGPTKNNNIVRQWKEKHKLESFFNCAQSPDLAPIENAWQPTKIHTRRHAHWDDETLTELILEGWAGITQDWINRRIDSMPLRLQEVIEREGKLVNIDKYDYTL